SVNVVPEKLACKADSPHELEPVPPYPDALPGIGDQFIQPRVNVSGSTVTVWAVSWRAEPNTTPKQSREIAKNCALVRFARSGLSFQLVVNFICCNSLKILSDVKFLILQVLVKQLRVQFDVFCGSRGWIVGREFRL